MLPALTLHAERPHVLDGDRHVALDHRLDLDDGRRRRRRGPRASLHPITPSASAAMSNVRSRRSPFPMGAASWLNRRADLPAGYARPQGPVYPRWSRRLSGLFG